MLDHDNMKTIDYMRLPSPVSGHYSEWYFFRSYVGTALWSSNGDNDEPLDRDHDIDDIDPRTLEKMLSDCAAFYFTNMGKIHCDGAPLSNEFEGPIGAREAAHAGHDFWLTRCGHGAGFWDGDWPEPYASELTKACEAFANVDLYIGDDGKIYA